MQSGVRHYPSVGSLVKKVIEINPDISVPEIMNMIRQSMKTSTHTGSDHVFAEFVDEAKVIELAKATLQ